MACMPKGSGRCVRDIEKRCELEIKNVQECWDNLTRVLDRLLVMLFRRVACAVEPIRVSSDIILQRRHTLACLRWVVYRPPL